MTIESASKKISELKSIMSDTIKSVLGRGKKIDVLLNSSGDILEEVQLFSERAQELREQAENKNKGLMLILLAMLSSGTVTIILGYTTSQILFSILLGALVGYALNRARESIHAFFKPAAPHFKPLAEMPPSFHRFSTKPYLKPAKEQSEHAGLHFAFNRDKTQKKEMIRPLIRSVSHPHVFKK